MNNVEHCDTACTEWTRTFVGRFLKESTNGLDPTANFATCPVGLLFLLATLLGSGAPKGRTAGEIATALNISDTNGTQIEESTIQYYQALADSLTSEVTDVDGKEQPVVRMSNGIFVDKTFCLKKKFADTVRKTFGAQTQRVNFNQDASGIINEWADEKSNGLIPKLLEDPNQLDGVLTLVVNVLTFENAWYYEFENVAAGKFFRSETDYVKVEMMEGLDEMIVQNEEDLGATFIYKQFENLRFYFVIVLPNEKWNMSSLEKVLRGEYVHKPDFGNIKYTGATQLSLPKFNLSANNNLLPTAQRLGIFELFEQSKADLSGLTTVPNIYISRLTQGVNLRVDEKGVAAAAATISELNSPSFKKNIYVVDHPFVCMIYDSKLDIPIFMARVMDPTK